MNISHEDLINGIYVGQVRVQILFGFLIKLSGFKDENSKWPALCFKLRAIYVAHEYSNFSDLR